MPDQPSYFTYYCQLCQQEHIQPCFGSPPAENDKPTSCGQHYPAYPSVIATVAEDRYEDAMDSLKGVPLVFFDGETILVPEEEKVAIAMLRERFQAALVYGQAAEYEFATKARKAGVRGQLLRLGQAVHNRTGQTADEMVNNALERPGPTLLAWQALYGSSMTHH